MLPRSRGASHTRAAEVPQAQAGPLKYPSDICYKFFAVHTAQRETAPCKALGIIWAILDTKRDNSITHLQCLLLYQGPEIMWMKKIPCLR